MNPSALCAVDGNFIFRGCEPTVNCIGSFSSCEADCADQVFTVDTLLAGEGDPCAHEADATLPCAPGDDACPVNTDCVGSWSTCGTDCTKRFTAAIPQSGQGVACEAGDDATMACAAGEDACPPNVDDCEGSWSTCNADCDDKIFTVTVVRSGDGGACMAQDQETVPCQPGEGQCPANIDCSGTWSDCSRGCEKRFEVSSQGSGQGDRCEAEAGSTMTCSFGEGQCIPPPTYAWSAPAFALCTTHCGENSPQTRPVVCEATVDGSTTISADSNCEASAQPPAERVCRTVPAGSSCDDGDMSSMNDMCVPDGVRCDGTIPGYCSSEIEDQGPGETECTSAGTCTTSVADDTITESECVAASKTWSSGSCSAIEIDPNIINAIECERDGKTWTPFTWTADQDCSTLDVSTPDACNANRDHCTYSADLLCQGKVSLVAEVRMDIAIDGASLAAITDDAVDVDESPIATTFKAALQPILTAAGMECTEDDITILSIVAGSLVIDYKVEVPAESATPEIKDQAVAAVANPALVNLDPDAMAITVEDPITGDTIVASGAQQEPFKSFSYARLAGSCDAEELCTGELTDGMCACSTACGQAATRAADIFTCLEEDPERWIGQNEVQLLRCFASLGPAPATSTLCCEGTVACESIDDCDGDASCTIDVITEAIDVCRNETYREELGLDRTECVAAATGLSDATINQAIVIIIFVCLGVLALTLFLLWKLEVAFCKAEHWLWAKCTSSKHCCCGKATENREMEAFERRRQDDVKDDTETETGSEDKTLAQKAAEAEAQANAWVGSEALAAKEARLKALQARRVAEMEGKAAAVDPADVELDDGAAGATAQP